MNYRIRDLPTDIRMEILKYIKKSVIYKMYGRRKYSIGDLIMASCANYKITEDLKQAISEVMKESYNVTFDIDSVSISPARNVNRYINISYTKRLYKMHLCSSDDDTYQYFDTFRTDKELAKLLERYLIIYAVIMTID